ncbi:MAG TPA: AfsR/SARP family transcriptional regulator [Streptosporangiaceae bacterium]
MAILQFRILGPLDVIGPDGPVGLDGRKRRALLIALLAHPNEVVGVDRLQEWLWPAGSPPTSIQTLQAHVSILRRTLEPTRPPWRASGVILTRSPGYMLRATSAELDTLHFEELLRSGREALDRGEPANAGPLLRTALDLWRGEALADVAMLDAAQAEIRRLEELRLAATVLRIEADLALGRHLDVVPELTRLVAAQPLHERLYALLMLALCRCGRRADALAVYARARDVLRHEMGLSPGPALRRMRAAVIDDPGKHPSTSYPSTSSLLGGVAGL